MGGQKQRLETGTKQNHENLAAVEVLYDYLTEHAVTSGRFVPFKYMIARDFPGRRVPALPGVPAASLPPRFPLPPVVDSRTPASTCLQLFPPRFKLFHPAAHRRLVFVDGFKESLARSRLITEIMGIKNERL